MSLMTRVKMMIVVCGLGISITAETQFIEEDGDDGLIEH